MSKFYRLSILTLTLVGLLAAVALRPVQPVYADCTSSATYAANVLADNPDFYWRLGNASGNATENGGGQVGNATGIVYSQVGLNNTADNAMQFTGTNSRLEFGAVDTGTSAVANLNDAKPQGGSSGYTIEMWFGAFDVDSATNQVLWEQGGGTNAFLIYIRSGQLYMRTYNSNGANAWQVSTPVTEGVAHHLALVYAGNAGNTGTMTGYLDGVAFGPAINVGAIPAHAGDVTIGDSGDNANLHFDNTSVNLADSFPFAGIIDEVAVFNEALTANDYNPAVAGSRLFNCDAPLAVSLSGQGVAQPTAVLPWLALIATSMGIVSLIALRRQRQSIS